MGGDFCVKEAYGDSGDETVLEVFRVFTETG